MTETKSSGGFPATTLKTIAIIAMIIDHIAVGFVPRESMLGLVMHMIGRLTTPIMAYFVAEGYFHTRNVMKYALRLAVFALISHIPYNWFLYGSLSGALRIFPTSVMFSLLCGLMALWAWDKISFMPSKILVSIGLILMTYRADSYIFAATYILLFGIFRGSFTKQAAAFSIAALIPIGFNIYYYVGRMDTVTLLLYYLLPYIGSYFALPLLSAYNGQRGSVSAFSKWAFYVIYPLQFVILAILKYGLNSLMS